MICFAIYGIFLAGVCFPARYIASTNMQLSNIGIINFIWIPSYVNKANSAWTALEIASPMTPMDKSRIIYKSILPLLIDSLVML